ncbi:alpha-1,3-mannosyl-glycoprotein 2-beta-N-acetylglucosaminyltransferase-like [Uloborus diversus]|uniref:alpha-1,3-mannosyl-glycoprotein 2-beta-N-acetylglucosaminyltransferase-like n=1 Tax=Uloborus diversus TaxID=327109 RepID=UPI002409AF5A|nr:alpha-1,3-mannosyl-glycoprotein 2-beta-N-acetylglucosaminyltransferase-like [Uloborus diversus]
MRKRTFVLIVTLALLSWAAVTYHLFLQRPQGKAQRSVRFQEQLELLESELKYQLKSNDELLFLLHQFRSKYPDKIKNLKSLASLEQKYAPDFSNVVIGVLVFACNRVTVKRNLDQLLKFRPSAEQFPIVVSQDCGHEPTTRVIQSYGDQLTLIQHPDQSDITLSGKEKKFKGYYKIARHYGWALNETFFRFNFKSVIIVEDDLDIAPDFFEYFLATYPILHSDPTLWCVSAWNDNGKDSVVAYEPELLYRSDFFPGLGWMLTKSLWMELAPKWPKAFWDDWIRQPAQRKERACIRPEISRSKTFGKVGVSNGLFYEKHLKFIRLNDRFVPFTKMDLSYLKKDNYDVAFVKQIYGVPPVTLHQLQRGSIEHSEPVRITYENKDIFKKTAKALGLMDDFKSGVPRTGYRGVVSFMYKGRRVYLAPPADWKGYDPTWS